MIITDPNLAPRLRLAEVLHKQLVTEGNRFVKSKNEFVLDFAFGKKVIRLSFNSSMGYISGVDCFIYLIFNDIEKDFKKVLPEYGGTNWTLCRSIYWESGWLCDEQSGAYTDQTINAVADKFFSELKPKIDAEFSKANNYHDLKALFLGQEQEGDLINWLRPEKRAILKLLLLKAGDPTLMDAVIAQERSRLNDYQGHDRDEVLSEAETAIAYLKAGDDIKLKTAKHL